MNNLLLSSFPLTINHVENLSQCVIQCSPFGVLQFCNIPLNDGGFIIITIALRRQAVQVLQCRNCGLTDKNGPILLGLVSFHTKIQKIAGKNIQQNNEPDIGLVYLRQYGHSENKLTNKFVESIVTDINMSPVQTINLSGNEEIEETLIESPKLIFGSGDFCNSKGKKLALYEKELRKENEKLKQIFTKIVGGKDVVALRSDLYAIGQRAAKLTEHIKILDEFLFYSMSS